MYRGTSLIRNSAPVGPYGAKRERNFFIDNLLVQIHFIIVMIRWTGLAPWGIEFPFPGSLTSIYLPRYRADVLALPESSCGT